MYWATFGVWLIFFGACALLDEMARHRLKARTSKAAIERARDLAVAAVSRELDRMMRDALCAGAAGELVVQEIRDPQEQAYQEWCKEREQAEAASRQWLRHWLSPKQREEFDNGAVVNKEGRRWPESFWVTGSKGTRFLVFSASSFNIIQYCDCGLAWRSLCASPDPLLHLPEYDGMALQKWHLEDDEEAVIKVANKSPCPPFTMQFPFMRPPLCVLASADELVRFVEHYRGRRHAGPVIGEVTS
jgi:hypothetical protein